jgi:hypothetical protein
MAHGRLASQRKRLAVEAVFEKITFIQLSIVSVIFWYTHFYGKDL